jgi:hypothetical protein
MATQKKKKKTKADKQKEIDFINLQIRWYQDIIKQLTKRKRKLEEKDNKKKPPKWNKDTPIYKIINPNKYDDLTQKINIWQQVAKEKIDNRTVYFNFDLKYKHRIISSFAEMFKSDIPFFNVKIVKSKDQVFKYFEQHSNLGRWDTLKREVNREIKKSRDTKLL